MLCLLFDGRRRREGKEKRERVRERERKTAGGGFPGAIPTMLAVPQDTVVRCN
jgi:hypothetical protein